VVRGVITQNVDGLHQAAGSRAVVELHGSLSFVRCLECGHRLARGRFQDRLRADNRDWLRAWERPVGDTDIESAPDGDAELPAGVAERFRVPACGRCDGVLKPDVVFFGENVPRPRVERAWELYEEADILLVVGSSLTVYSGRRFTQRAEKERLPVAIVNLGETRADAAAAAKVEGRLGDVLPRLAATLLRE
jgi:NAD-dependent deacetylase sirtuin 4